MGLLSAFWHAGRDNSGSTTRSILSGPLHHRAVGDQVGRLLVWREQQHPRELFGSPALDFISIALSLAYSSVPTGTPTSFTPLRSAMRTPTPLRRVIGSGVGTCPFGGKATVLLGSIAMPTS